MQPIETTFANVEGVLDVYRITDADKRAAVRDAYDVVGEHQALLITSVAAEMIRDIKADITADPEHKVVFLGRDGHSLAAAVRALDPGLFAANCREVTVSRVAVEAAVQDREINADIDFALPDTFRGVRDDVKEEDVTGAYQMLTRYLRGAGAPVGGKDSSITVVDTSLKGTVQELMAALYPDTKFQGRYAFFADSPDDPHPGTKVGYAVHRPDNEIWRTYVELTENPADTFAARDAIACIEYTLNGPLTSPRRFTAQGPVQAPQRQEPNQLTGINPGLIAEPYKDPAVREASKAAALLAVHDTASQVARTHRGQDPIPELRTARTRFTEQVRSWIARTGDVDPKLGTFLDSFVRRTDRELVKGLEKEIKDRGIAADEAANLYQGFADAVTLRGKSDFVENAFSLKNGFRKDHVPTDYKRDPTKPQAADSPAARHRKAPETQNKPAPHRGPLAEGLERGRGRELG